MKIRLQGLLAFGIAALVEYAYVSALINDAESGTPKLVVSKFFIFVPFAVMGVGLFSLALGNAAMKYLEMDDNNLTFTNVAILAVPGIFSVVAYALVVNQLAALGYS